ncbi:MAG: flavin reductase family protein [Nitrososphaerota archaeon]|nr:flavin reductase family protein [Nitrososphaerota archaeon]
MARKKGPNLKDKVAFAPDKRKWHPSPILGQLVLVTTLNEDGVSNVAPKNWISYMAFGPSIIALGCSTKHWTAKNILRSREFVINIPGAELVDTIWEAGYLDHPRPVESLKLTPIPSLKVKPPRIEECGAHLECVLDKHFSYGSEIIILGRIVAASIDREALEAKDPYKYLRMLVFLEDGTFGTVMRAEKLNANTQRRLKTLKRFKTRGYDLSDRY